MSAPESPIPLQSDTLQTLPGGGVRTVVAVVMIGGVPTPVQMQVVTLADKDGVLIDAPNDNILREICNHLKDLKQIIAVATGQAIFEQQNSDIVRNQ